MIVKKVFCEHGNMECNIPLIYDGPAAPTVCKGGYEEEIVDTSSPKDEWAGPIPPYGAIVIMDRP